MTGTGITRALEGLHDLLVERNRARLLNQEIENRIEATLAHLTKKIERGNNRNEEPLEPAPGIVLQLSHVRD